MRKKIDTSRIDAIYAKVKAGDSQSASYAEVLFRSHFQAKAASTQRQDALQKLIIEIVKKKREISRTELLRELKRQKGLGVIQDFPPDDTIRFTSPNGKPNKAEVSGLKDRLRRAKAYVQKDSR